MSDSYKSDLDIMTSFSILSMLACSTVILPLLSTLELRQGTFARLALFISVSDFFNDLGLAARSLDINNSTTCTFQAFISTFCALASMFWIVLLTHFVFRLVVLNHRNVRIVIMHQCVCWGVPLFLTLIPLVNVTYGVWPGSATAKGTSFLSVQCLFQPLPSSPSWVFHPINNIWAYISLIVWVYLLLVIMIIEILIVLIKSSQLDNIDTRLQIRKFVMYPIALIITQGMFFFYIVIWGALYGNVVSPNVPGRLLCLTFLPGFCNTICFWYVNEEARLWANQYLCLILRPRFIYAHRTTNNGSNVNSSMEGDDTIEYHTDPETTSMEKYEIPSASNASSRMYSSDFESIS